MDTMLECTLKAFPNRVNELPDNVSWLVDYFEEGCVCLQECDLPRVDDQPEEVKALYYLMWCGCSRHPEYHEKLSPVEGDEK
jgi:hypothetical protein